MLKYNVMLMNGVKLVRRLIKIPQGSRQEYALEMTIQRQVDLSTSSYEVVKEPFGDGEVFLKAMFELWKPIFSSA